MVRVGFMSRWCFLLICALCAESCLAQTVFEPTKLTPTTGYRFRCVLPKGWAAGMNESATYLDYGFKDQLIFCDKTGQSLIGITSTIDADGSLAKQSIDVYATQVKRGLGITHQRIGSGDLYAFFMNRKDKPYRSILIKGHAQKSLPRHFAQIFVISNKHLFYVSFSSFDRDMVKDALAVAKSYKPVEK
jgi:hypothetical protein